MSERLVVWLSTHPVTTWLVKHVASRLDPPIFKAINGRRPEDVSERGASGSRRGTCESV